MGSPRLARAFTPAMAGERGACEPRVIQLDFPPLYPEQARVVSEAKRFNVANFGRRTGKTTLGESRLAEVAIAGFPVAYFTPTYKMLAEVWRDLAKKLAPVTARAQVSEKRIELKSGGSIDLWSMDDAGNACRGRKYKRVIIDECAMVPALIQAWEETIRPTLTDLRGDAWFLSTPKRGSGFEELYNRGQRGDEGWMSWKLTTFANPFIDPEEIEEARRTMSTASFAQEYLADFDQAESDLVFPEFEYSKHVKPAPCTWEECKWRVIGIDPGGGDPTAIVPLGVSKNEHVHQYGEFYQRGGVSLDDIAGYVGQWDERARVDFIVVDPSAKTIPESLRSMGFRASPALNKREEGLETVRYLLEVGRLTIDPVCKESINEFAGYRWKKTRDSESGERFATRTAFDNHADAMDARRYACMAIIRGIRGAVRNPRNIVVASKPRDWRPMAVRR